jgi:adenylate kinase
MDEFTKYIANVLSSGQLVDDQIVIDIVRQLKENPETFMGGQYMDTAGLILDGVPRTVKQAEMLSEFTEVDLILNFVNREDILVQKLCGRRVCPDCNKNFNIADVNTDGYVMEPLLPKGDDPTVCDAHGDAQVKLIMREDDKEEIILSRLETYKSETLPILDYYQGNTSTPVIEFEAKRGKKDYPTIKEMLLEKLGESVIPETIQDSSMPLEK